MEMLRNAIKFATKLHAGQVRAVTGEPYITHPLAVACLVALYVRSKHLQAMMAAAVLHDCLEESDTTVEDIKLLFGSQVAMMTQELTNDPVELARLGKLDYQTNKMLRMSVRVLCIKLADRMHNISENPRPKMISDTRELMSRLRGGRRLTKVHLAMVTEIERLCDVAESRIAATSVRLA